MKTYCKQKLTYYCWMNKNKKSKKCVVLFYFMLVVHGFCLSWLPNLDTPII
jgi:hypothetical protein